MRAAFPSFPLLCSALCTILSKRFGTLLLTIIRVVNFSIAENDITGAIPPELASNIAIQNLFIDRTTLTSGLPPTLCDNLVNIQQFWSDCTEIGGCECCTTCCEGDVCLPT
mmetsp:Transcript_2102/g.5832  ORF Transcript_2102/g.5832 Transcript_2102/m.5832 type:complete len:111 (-) Transcript_2102:222-554(-)